MLPTLVHVKLMLCALDEFLEEHHRVLDLRLQPVVREITDSRARTRDDLESLYRKIVSYVLLRSGLGNATDVGVVREATGSLLQAFHTSTDSNPTAALIGNPSQSYCASPAIWDWTMLPATIQVNAPALTPARQAGTRSTYPGGIEG